MSSQQRVVQTGALPPNTVKPFPQGSNSVYTAGTVQQNNQNAAQNALVGNRQAGGKKRKLRLRGGAPAPLSPAPSQPPVVQVAAAPSYAVNKTETNSINTQIAGLAVSTQNNAALDGTVNGNQADAALISAQQQAVYSGKGGSIRRRHRTSSNSKKGGSWPVWGCLSGGKKSRRYKKCKCKRRKTRKHMKRHHR